MTVGLGDASAETVTTVKAEVRRLVLERVRTAPGEFATRTFTVAIRRPEYPGGIVRLSEAAGEDDRRLGLDNRLTLEFCDEKPSLRFLEIEPAKDLPTFFLVGDSTMCDQSREPFNSWGQMITRWFGPGIVVSNHAESGESTRSYLGERRWPKVMSLIRPGDYLCVQLGHNDEHEKGGDGLRIVPEDPRADGDRHPGARRDPDPRHPDVPANFDASGHVVNDHGDFPEAVRRVARELNVPLVDLNAMSKVLYETLGPADTIAVFATMNGKTDATHQSDYGSYELAQCVVRGIRESVPALAQYLLPDTPAFDPAHPDPMSLRRAEGDADGDRAAVAALSPDGPGSDRLRKGDPELDGVRVLPLDLVPAGAPAEHPVELLDEDRDGLVALVGLDDRVHRGLVDQDVPLRLEPSRHVYLGIEFQLDPQADDAVLVSEQSVGFLCDEGLDGGSEVEMNAGHDQFTTGGFIHGMHRLTSVPASRARGLVGLRPSLRRSDLPKRENGSSNPGQS